MSKETKPYTGKYGFTSEFGRSYCYIDCPFCGASVRCFIWSLAGGGKKCNCGAKIGNHGTATKNTTN